MRHAMGEFVRCLLCVTGEEEYVAHGVRTMGLGEPLFPRKRIRVRKKEGWVEEFPAMLPGYLFVYADRPDIPPESYIALDHVVRVLRYGEEPHGFLYGEDLNFARWLREQNGVLDLLQAVKEGDFVRVNEGPLRNFSGRVTRVDRRKKLARLELMVLGQIRTVWLSYELLTNDEEE